MPTATTSRAELQRSFPRAYRALCQWRDILHGVSEFPLKEYGPFECLPEILSRDDGAFLQVEFRWANRSEWTGWSIRSEQDPRIDMRGAVWISLCDALCRLMDRVMRDPGLESRVMRQIWTQL